MIFCCDTGGCPHNRIGLSPFLLRFGHVGEGIFLRDNAALRSGVQDVQRLRQPLVRPHLRVAHGLDQAEPVALVAVEFAGDAGPAVAALDRRIAPVVQQLVAEEGGLVDLAGYLERLPSMCGIATDFLLILERFGPFEF
jgi:hypothetical protein